MKNVILLFLLTTISTTSIAQETIPSTPNTIPIQPDGSSKEGAREPAGKGLDFVSLKIGNFKDGNVLSLNVPNPTGGKKPQVLVQYPPKSYRWNPQLYLNRANEFEARWSSDKLYKQKIAPQQLFVRAEVDPQGADSNSLFMPVILDRSAGQYEFTFYCTQCEAQIKQASVISNHQRMSCRTINDPITPRVLCDGRQAKAGRYRIVISGSLILSGSTQAEPIPGMSYGFKHDPRWFR
ncbi:MAG: hypothetical protein ACREPR_24950 [Brasilonema sp.]